MIPESKLPKNIAILAHVDAGKTTVSERLLYFSETISNMGEVDEGLATMDYLEEEKKRGITIEAGIASYTWKKQKVTFVDTPGHVDFGVEVDFALKAVEGVILVLSGINGIESQSLQAWEKIRANKNQCILFINKLDVQGADHKKVLEQVATTFGVTPILMTIPVYMERQLDGVVDVLHQLALYRSMENPRKLVKGGIPDFLREDYLEARKSLIDAASEFNDSILEDYLAGREIPSEDIVIGITQAIASRRYVPVYMGAALKNLGIRQVMNGINAFLPHPTIQPEQEARLGLVIKIRFYQGVGKIYLVKAFSDLAPVDVGAEGFFRVMAETLEPVTTAEPGEIVAMLSRRALLMGDDLKPPPEGSVPRVSSAKNYEPLLHARLELERDEPQLQQKLGHLLQELAEADPSISARPDPETGNWLVSAVGELQLEIFHRRLRREHKVPVVMGQPKVHYEERLARSLGVIRNTLRWNHVDVVLELELEHDPLLRTNELATSGLALSGEGAEALDSAYRQFCDQGVCGYGSIAGLRCRITRVESSADVTPLPALFKCFSDALSLNVICNDIQVYEPLMRLEVIVPDEFCGNVLSDLAARGAAVRKLDSDGQNSLISLEIPLEKTFGYSTLLRSLTKGRGVFVLTYEKHSPRSKDKTT